MPQEIADSDAESDYEADLSKTNAPIATATTAETSGTISAKEPTGSISVNFDDFISQPRSVSHQFPTEDRLPKLDAGSTKKLLWGIADAQHNLAGTCSSKTLSTVKTQTQVLLSESPSETLRKRKHIAIEGAGEAQESGQERNSKQKKRAKTYGNSRVHLSSSQSDFFGHDGSAESGPQQRAILGEVDRDVTDDLQEIENETNQQTPAMPPPPRNPADYNEDDEDDEFHPRQRNRPRRVISLLEQNQSFSHGEISTARSSMGGYESLNMDFRGSTYGMGIDVNPFGTLSQISVGGDFDEAESERLASMFRHGPTPTGALTGMDTDADNMALCEESAAEFISTGHHMTPGRARSIDPSVLMNQLPDDLPNDTQLLSSSTSSHMRRRTENAFGSTFNPTQELDRTHTPAIKELSNNEIVPKKRGRKPKNQRLPTMSPAPSTIDVDEIASYEIGIGLPMEQYKPKPSRSRTGKVDLNIEDLPNVYEAQNGNAQAKAKPGRPKSDIRGTSEKVDLSSPIKQLISELNLSDEAIIGMPRENYKPRPSRSRRATANSIQEDPHLDVSANEEKKKEKGKNISVKTTEHEKNISQSSPVKQPTSELKLGDEEAIGLPRERYKPKPSRSRSKMIVDEEENTTKLGQDKTPTNAEAEMKASPPKTQKKKGNKTKVKRAKTSAAALLKKSEQMFSDGEDDVIYMDEKPAKVKLNLPPDMKLGQSVKQEAEEKPKVTEQETQSQLEKNRSVALDKLEDRTVETTTESFSAKRTFSIDIPPPRDTAGEPSPPEPKKGGRERKKTTELPKDEVTEEDNAKSSQTKTRPALQERDANFQPDTTSHASKPSAVISTLSPQKEDITEALATPSKPALAAESSPTKASDKGPTKHSPINPPGSKAKYRVGLSRRAPIPSLLKIVRKDTPPVTAPKKPKRGKVKETGIEVDVENEIEQTETQGDDEHAHQRRDKDGMGALRRNPQTGLLEEYISD